MGGFKGSVGVAGTFFMLEPTLAANLRTDCRLKQKHAVSRRKGGLWGMCTTGERLEACHWNHWRVFGQKCTDPCRTSQRRYVDGHKRSQRYVSLADPDQAQRPSNLGRTTTIFWKSRGLSKSGYLSKFAPKKTCLSTETRTFSHISVSFRVSVPMWELTHSLNKLNRLHESLVLITRNDFVTGRITLPHLVKHRQLPGLLIYVRADVVIGHPHGGPLRWPVNRGLSGDACESRQLVEVGGEESGRPGDFREVLTDRPSKPCKRMGTSSTGASFTGVSAWK